MGETPHVGGKDSHRAARASDFLNNFKHVWSWHPMCNDVNPAGAWPSAESVAHGAMRVPTANLFLQTTLMRRDLQILSLASGLAALCLLACHPAPGKHEVE